MNNSIIEIPNFIRPNEQNLLENYVRHPNFKWSYYEGTILKTDLLYTNDCIIQQGINPPQFSHLVNIRHNSNVIFIKPIFDAIANHFNLNLQILKCKYNLLTKRNCSFHHYPHSDLDDYENDIFTGIYYVNNSDGDTYLFNEFAPKKDDTATIMQKIKPEKGKLILFDSRRFHASSSPLENEIRLVLNIVFKVTK